MRKQLSEFRLSILKIRVRRENRSQSGLSENLSAFKCEMSSRRGSLDISSTVFCHKPIVTHPVCTPQARTGSAKTPMKRRIACGLMKDHTKKDCRRGQKYPTAYAVSSDTRNCMWYLRLKRILTSVSADRNGVYIVPVEVQ
jgi:hypothetical protein